MPKSNNVFESESGTTLTELMMAVAIFSVIGLFASQFYARMSSSDSEISAKNFSKEEISRVNSFIEKDLKYRDITVLVPICNAALCTSFTIRRMEALGGVYDVTYASSCLAFPANMGQVANLSFSTSALANPTNPNRSRCMAALNCPAGQYPTIQVTTANVPVGASLPNYPDWTPLLASGKGVAYSIVGAALCVEQTQTIVPPAPATPIFQDQIQIEAAFLSAEADGAGMKSLRFETKNSLFTSRNVAKIQVLP